MVASNIEIYHIQAKKYTDVKLNWWIQMQHWIRLMELWNGQIYPLNPQMGHRLTHSNKKKKNTSTHTSLTKKNQ